LAVSLTGRFFSSLHFETGTWCAQGVYEQRTYNWLLKNLRAARRRLSAIARGCRCLGFASGACTRDDHQPDRGMPGPSRGIAPLPSLALLVMRLSKETRVTERDGRGADRSMSTLDRCCPHPMYAGDFPTVVEFLTIAVRIGLESREHAEPASLARTRCAGKCWFWRRCRLVGTDAVPEDLSAPGSFRRRRAVRRRCHVAL
jgi:hypothetical protein